MKISIKDFLSKCDQIRRSHLLRKSLMQNLIFCAVVMDTQLNITQHNI